MLWVFFFLATITLWTTQMNAGFDSNVFYCNVKLRMKKEKNGNYFFLSVVSNQWYAKAHTRKLKYGCVSPVISTWIHKTMSFEHDENMEPINGIECGDWMLYVKIISIEYSKANGMVFEIRYWLTCSTVEHRFCLIWTCDATNTERNFSSGPYYGRIFFMKKCETCVSHKRHFFVIEKRIGRKKMYYNIWQFVPLTWSATKWNVAIMYIALRT